MLLLKLLLLHEGNLSQSMCSTMVHTFVTFFELLPSPVHCVIFAEEKEECSNYTSLSYRNHITILIHAIGLKIHKGEDFFTEFLQECVGQLRNTTEFSGNVFFRTWRRGGKDFFLFI